MSEHSESAEEDVDIKIIKLVKDQSILWDRCNTQYYNNTKKSGIWATLGAEVGMTKGYYCLFYSF